MSAIKPKLSFLIICRCILVLWLLVLSFLVFSNLGVTTQLVNVANTDQKSPHIQAIEAQLIQLSEQLNVQRQALLTNPTVSQAELTHTQQELKTRIQAVSDQFDNYATKAEIQALQLQLNALSETVQKLQEAITTKPVAPTQPTPTTTIQPARTAQPQRAAAQPFKVLGSELRGGERFLAVQPLGHDEIASVILLGAGHSISNWILQSIGDNTAIFKVANRQRRVSIPQ